MVLSTTACRTPSVHKTHWCRHGIAIVRRRFQSSQQQRRSCTDAPMLLARSCSVLCVHSRLLVRTANARLPRLCTRSLALSRTHPHTQTHTNNTRLVPQQLALVLVTRIRDFDCSHHRRSKPTIVPRYRLLEENRNCKSLAFTMATKRQVPKVVIFQQSERKISARQTEPTRLKRPRLVVEWQRPRASSVQAPVSLSA